MTQLFLLISLQVLLFSCNNNTVAPPGLNTIAAAPVNPYKQIKTIPLPAEFERVKADSLSFTWFLRNIDLKEQTTVYLYNGQQKRNQAAQYALLNISTGNKDLQQCADAVMRLRAEYLFSQKEFGQIIFYSIAYSTNNCFSFFWQFVNVLLWSCCSRLHFNLRFNYF